MRLLAMPVLRNIYISSILIVCLYISFAITRHIVGFAQVTGTSMYPTLVNGEVYQIAKPTVEQLTRGTIVVVKDDQNSLAVKRIIGLPGEIVEFSRGDVYINNRRLNEPYIPTNTATFGFPQIGDKIQVPVGKFIVLGDNRNNSHDSRTYGPLNRNQIIGFLNMATYQPIITTNSLPVRYAKH